MDGNETNGGWSYSGEAPQHTEPRQQPVPGDGNGAYQSARGQSYQYPGYDYAQAQAYQQPVQPQPAQPRQKPKRGHGARQFLIGVCGGVVASAATIAVASSLGMFGGGAGTTPDPVDNGQQQINIDASDMTETSVAKAVASKCLPSVVSIATTSAEGEGVGSGVILDTDGNTLTNYHVIAGADELAVNVGKKSYSATVVGTDPSSDLAVIKLELNGDKVTPIERGDSEKLSVGDWVMAIGSPYGLDQSVSTGIVSSLYRSTLMQGYTGSTVYANLIQTDASINPGNSGGALVNAEGKLVGISSLLESTTGSNVGLGFAIDGNYALEVADTLVSGKTVEHASLGVTVATVNAANAERAGLSVTSGAYVRTVDPDSAAGQSGIKEGDVITAVGDSEISTGDALILNIRSHKVGDKVPVTVRRDDKDVRIDVTLGSDGGTSTAGVPQNQGRGSDMDQLMRDYMRMFGYGEDGDR